MTSGVETTPNHFGFRRKAVPVQNYQGLSVQTPAFARGTAVALEGECEVVGARRHHRSQEADMKRTLNLKLEFVFGALFVSLFAASCVQLYVAESWTSAINVPLAAPAQLRVGNPIASPAVRGFAETSARSFKIARD
jgi:hypothetical protein